MRGSVFIKGVPGISKIFISYSNIVNNFKNIEVHLRKINSTMVDDYARELYNDYVKLVHNLQITEYTISSDISNSIYMAFNPNELKKSPVSQIIEWTSKLSDNNSKNLASFGNEFKSTNGINSMISAMAPSKKLLDIVPQVPNTYINTVDEITNIPKKIVAKKNKHPMVFKFNNDLAAQLNHDVKYTESKAPSETNVLIPIRSNKKNDLISLDTIKSKAVIIFNAMRDNKPPPPKFNNKSPSTYRKMRNYIRTIIRIKLNNAEIDIMIKELLNIQNNTGIQVLNI